MIAINPASPRGTDLDREASRLDSFFVENIGRDRFMFDVGSRIGSKSAAV